MKTRRQTGNIYPTRLENLHFSVFLLCLFTFLALNEAHGQSTTPLGTPNELYVTVLYPERISVDTSNTIRIVSELTNPQCPDPQTTTGSQITHIITIVATSASLEIAPQNQRSNSTYITQLAVVGYSRVDLQWVIQPIIPGFFNFVVDVQVLWGTCSLKSFTNDFPVTAVDKYGLTSTEGALVYPLLALLATLFTSGFSLWLAKSILHKLKMIDKQGRLILENPFARRPIKTSRRRRRKDS